MFDKQAYIQRRNKLRAQFDHGVVLMLGNQEASMNYPHNHYRFRQDSSFLYFYGLDKPNLVGVMDIDNNQDYIFGDDFSIDDVVWMGPQPTMEDMVKSVGVINWMSSDSLKAFFKEVIRDRRVVHFLPAYRGEQTLLLEGLLGIHHSEIPEYASEQLIKAVVDIRSYKSPEEVVEMDQTLTNVTYDMFVTAMKMAKPGVNEREIAGEVEGIALSGGAQLAYPIIGTVNGQTLHNNVYKNELKEGDLYLLDAGAESLKHYATDITRTFPVGGKFTEKQKGIYNIVLKAETESIKNLRPGVTYKSIHLGAAKIIVEGLKDLGLMKGDSDEAVRDGAHALFFPHGLGHMIGLDVHDMEGYGEDFVGYNDEVRRSDQFGTAYLRLGRKLEEGFVVTVEPGIYFIPELLDKWKADGTNAQYLNFDKIEEYRDFGGIRIEDDVLVTAEGSKVLGKTIPKTVEDIEAVMAQ